LLCYNCLPLFQSTFLLHALKTFHSRAKRAANIALISISPKKIAKKFRQKTRCENCRGSAAFSPVRHPSRTTKRPLEMVCTTEPLSLVTGAQPQREAA